MLSVLGSGLDGGPAEEGCGGEFGGAGPAGDVEGVVRMGFVCNGVNVVVAEGLLDAMAGGFLLGA